MRRRDAKRPLIFAHRGACKVAPENTLPAFQAALDLGADGIELDVQFSSDGKLVVLHNPTLETTTNGSGRVTAYTFAELRLLDAGSHFGPQFAGTPLPALEEVLDLCKGRLLMNIELKSLNSNTANIGVDVVAAVRARDMADQVVISSFNPLALRRAKKAGPEIECALLTAPDLPGMDARRPHLQLQPGRCGAPGIPHGRCDLHGLGGQAQDARAPVDGQRGRRHAADDRAGCGCDHHGCAGCVGGPSERPPGIGQNSQSWITD